MDYLHKVPVIVGHGLQRISQTAHTSITTCSKTKYRSSHFSNCVVEKSLQLHSNVSYSEVPRTCHIGGGGGISIICYDGSSGLLTCSQRHYTSKPTTYFLRSAQNRSYKKGHITCRFLP